MPSCQPRRSIRTRDSPIPFRPEGHELVAAPNQQVRWSERVMRTLLPIGGHTGRREARKGETALAPIWMLKGTEPPDDPHPAT